jgi:hypothetical protein
VKCFVGIYESVRLVVNHMFGVIIVFEKVLKVHAFCGNVTRDPTDEIVQSLVTHIKKCIARESSFLFSTSSPA